MAASELCKRADKKSVQINPQNFSLSLVQLLKAAVHRRI